MDQFLIESDSFLVCHAHKESQTRYCTTLKNIEVPSKLWVQFYMVNIKGLSQIQVHSVITWKILQVAAAQLNKSVFLLFQIHM